ncbi:MAG: glutathione-dependent formaldehyde-activating protein [bacterium]|nr:glutathione-dependent formaldehyde-activating protein [Gammaproteobacteria bacterium]
MTETITYEGSCHCGDETLANYQFEPKMVNHYYCSRCGIYPFHNGVESPGKYRVDLCCVDEIEAHELEIRVFDGRDSWKFLTT